MPTLNELATLLGGSVDGASDVVVDGVAAVEDAGPGQLTFITDDRYLPMLEGSRASAVVIAADKQAYGKPAIRVSDPMAVLPVLLARFAVAPPPDALREAIAPSAWVHPSAKLGARVRIGPCAVVDAEVEIGEGSEIGALCAISWGVRVGKDTRINSFVAIGERIVIGSRVVIHSGSVLGADGFGFLPGPDGPRKIPQIGRVVIEDDVEIGANCAIDRAMVGDTLIKRTAKLGDQVHVAHNCVIAEGCVVAGQSGLGGTVKLGRGCRLGAQSGIADHVTLGDGVEVGGKSGVHKSVPAGARMFGYPARPAGEALRLNAASSRLPGLFEKMRQLEKRIAELEKGKGE